MLRYLVSVCAVGFLLGATPIPAEIVPEPLDVIGATSADLAYAELIEEPDGARRQAGLFWMIVSPEFNTGVMGEANPSVELLVEEPTGLTGDDRLIIARVPDPGLDAMLAAMAAAPGVVVAPGKSYMFEIAANDPYWQGQVEAGLGCDFVAPTIQCPPPIVSLALNWILTEAIAGRIDVVNMSFAGSREDGQDYFFDALHSLDVRLVASAGNDGASPILYPAREDHVIAVGGVNPNGTRHPDSNYGNDLDVAAPYQTWALDEINAPWYFQGTSASAPVIAGYLALYKSMVFVEFEPGYTGEIWESRGSPWNSQTGHGVPVVPVNALLDFGCVRHDFDGSGEIDVTDQQLIAYRYGAEPPSQLYDPKYDLEPWVYVWPPQPVDFDIDIQDIQKIFGRDAYTCRQ